MVVAATLKPTVPVLKKNCDEAPAPNIAFPLTAKFPANVEVEMLLTKRLLRVVEPALRKPLNVEVELAFVTDSTPANVDVAVVEVAVM